jgi:hypothetical protein
MKLLMSLLVLVIFLGAYYWIFIPDKSPICNEEYKNAGIIVHIEINNSGRTNCWILNNNDFPVTVEYLEYKTWIGAKPVWLSRIEPKQGVPFSPLSNKGNQTFYIYKNGEKIGFINR